MVGRRIDVSVFLSFIYQSQCFFQGNLFSIAPHQRLVFVAPSHASNRAFAHAPDPAATAGIFTACPTDSLSPFENLFDILISEDLFRLEIRTGPQGFTGW